MAIISTFAITSIVYQFNVGNPYFIISDYSTKHDVTIELRWLMSQKIINSNLLQTLVAAFISSHVIIWRPKNKKKNKIK